MAFNDLDLRHSITMSHHCDHESNEHDHDGNHSHDNPDAGPQDNLYQHIDRDNVIALNAGDGRGPEVIKPWHERNDANLVCESARRTCSYV